MSAERQGDGGGGGLRARGAPARARACGLRKPTVVPMALDICAIAVAVVRSASGNQMHASRVTVPMTRGPAAAMRICPAWYMAKAADLRQSSRAGPDA